MGAVALGMVLLASGCTSEATPAVPAKTSPIPVAATGCVGVVTLTTTNGTRLVVQRDVRPTLIVEVGDRININANGSCGGQLSATPQSAGVLQPADAEVPARSWAAVAPGTVLLGFAHPMCANLHMPDCRGGVSGDGNVIVRVNA
jgi:hypothetical protein